MIKHYYPNRNIKHWIHIVVLNIPLTRTNHHHLQNKYVSDNISINSSTDGGGDAVDADVIIGYVFVL